MVSSPEKEEGKFKGYIIQTLPEVTPGWLAEILPRYPLPLEGTESPRSRETRIPAD